MGGSLVLLLLRLADRQSRPGPGEVLRAVFPDRDLTGRAVRARRARLHARVRDPGADQLRARGRVHARRHGHRKRSSSRWPGREEPHAFGVLMASLLVSLVLATGGLRASERDRRARCLQTGSTHGTRLAPLITAIGVSFILENVAIIWKGTRPSSPARNRARRRVGGGATENLHDRHVSELRRLHERPALSSSPSDRPRPARPALAPCGSPARGRRCARLPRTRTQRR